jgi:hypothetical protein
MKGLKPIYNGDPLSLDGKRVSKTELEQLRNLPASNKIIIKTPIGYHGNGGVLRLQGVGMDLNMEQKTKPTITPTYMLCSPERESTVQYEVNDVAMARFEREQKRDKLKKFQGRKERLKNLKEKVLTLHRKSGSGDNPFGNSLEEKRSILEKLRTEEQKAENYRNEKSGRNVDMPRNYELWGTGNANMPITESATPSVDTSDFGSLAAVITKIK